MCYLLKKYFWWLLRRVKNLRSTACKHYRKCDVIYKYLYIKLIWCLLMVQYLQNNVIMKWTTRFIRFTVWIPLKYGSTTTAPIIAHCQKTPMSSIVFHIAIPKTSNITCQCCSNYIFILNLTYGFNGMAKDSCKTQQEAFKFWDLEHLILEIGRYMKKLAPSWYFNKISIFWVQGDHIFYDTCPSWLLIQDLSTVP